MPRIGQIKKRYLQNEKLSVTHTRAASDARNVIRTAVGRRKKDENKPGDSSSRPHLNLRSLVSIPDEIFEKKLSQQHDPVLKLTHRTKEVKCIRFASANDLERLENNFLF